MMRRLVVMQNSKTSPQPLEEGKVAIYAAIYTFG